jgi:hypothetical protein
LTRGGILLLPLVLASGALAQAPGVQSSPSQPTISKALVTDKAIVLSDTEKIALQAVLKEREALGQKLQAIDTDVRKSHPGYHLEWGMENVTLVKDVEAPASAPKK